MGVPIVVQQKLIQLGTMRLWVRSLASLSGLLIQRCSDMALLWLWHRPAATALIRPLAWELPYVMGEALKKTPQKMYVCKYISIYLN